MLLSKFDKKSFIIGMLLGDGCTSLRRGAINYNLSCVHNPKQYEYLIWKMEILKENLQKTYWISQKQTHFSGKAVHPGNIGKVYKMYAATLGSHPLVTQVRKEMYLENKKIVTPNILRQLTPIGLAIWYMDDGNLAYHKNPNGSIKTRNVNLHIEGFDSDSQQNIVNYFLEVWNIKTSLHKTRDHFKLWMNTFNSIKFLRIVAPYIKFISCMKYKIDLKYERKNIELF